MKNKILAIVAVGLLAGPMAANAIPVTWTLEDVIFNDGSTIAGSFVFDADTNIFSSIGVTSSNGNAYFQVNPVSPGNAGFLGFLAGPAINLTAIFTAELAGLMTNAGGTLDIIPGFVFSGGNGFSFEGFCALACTAVSVERDVASGRITTAVPEPGTLALFGLGFLGLGFSRRRKHA